MAGPVRPALYRGDTWRGVLDPGMAKHFFKAWLKRKAAADGLLLLEEQASERAGALAALQTLLVEHYIDADVVERAGGFKRAADVIRNSIPTRKKARSGDLGEILAVELLHQETRFKVPIRKLRWKSDREMPLHGNDVIAVDVESGKKPRVLKGECKSRAQFSPSHVPEAAAALDDHGGRPNPSTLAFITKRLYEEERDDEAGIFRDLQAKGGLRLQDVEHLIFVLSGNDTANTLSTLPAPKKKTIRRRWAAGIVVKQHSDLIEAVYDQEERRGT